MRLPSIAGNFAHVDEEATARLLHDAIDAGVNYLDTAYPYHGGASEVAVGRALAGGWREHVLIATKLPMWIVKTADDCDRFLDEQLKRLDTGRIDFYLLHGLGAERWEAARTLRLLDRLERAKVDGRIGHIGFSFHDSFDVFKTIVDGYDWEFCQIQLNFLDREYQAGLAGMQYAAARQVGVVAMEPLRGGALAQAPPEVARTWARASRSRPPAAWALEWVWNHPEVVSALSGMNTDAQLRENLEAADTASALDAADLALIEEVRQFYQTRIRVPCTTCGYCEPCPNGVAIPNVLSLLNASAMFESKAAPSVVYGQWVLRSGSGADRCTECGECEPKCPQGIAIPARLKEAHEHLTT
jgi:predicted aldo/keto reductase-like oxidoreductase